MGRGRKPQEFLLGERVYNVSKAKNGRGDVYGICYLPEKLIGKKVTLNILKKEDYKMLEEVKRKYSLRKKMKGGKKIK